MATEKVRVMKIEHQKITTKKGTEREMRVLHCWIEQEYRNEETGEVIDGSFVAKTSLFDESINIEKGKEYVVEYRLGEGYGQDAGRLVPRIVKWTPYGLSARPVAKAGAGLPA